MSALVTEAFPNDLAEEETYSEDEEEDYAMLDYGSDDSSGETTIDLKSRLCDIFEAADEHYIGSFAASSKIASVPNPGLYVHGLGLIGMPLTVHDARRLAQASHQAPFGQGTETIVDTTVRKTWELNANQFELRNPDWLSFVESLKTDVSRELGIPDGARTIKLDLYKMLLYEEGAFFHKHRDSEKADGMFATLVIALPSEHEGGEVEATFGGQTMILDTASKSAFGFSWLAWYADVEHAVKPVIKGYRLVLTFNVIQAGNVSYSAITVGRQKARLELALKSWTQSFSSLPSSYSGLAPSKLIYMLDHKYTNANLRLAHLKGNDRVRALLSKRACEQHDYMLLLGHVTRTVSGPCDDMFGNSYGYVESKKFHEIEEPDEKTLDIDLIVNENGTQFAKDVPMKISDIIQPLFFEERDPDKEDYEGYTGNEGVSATHFYHDTCMILVPKRCSIDFSFIKASKKAANVPAWLWRLVQEHENESTDSRRTDILRLCHLIITDLVKQAGWYPRYYSHPRTGDDPDELVKLVLKVALRMKEPEIIEQTARLMTIPMPLKVFKYIGTLLQHLQWNQIVPALNLSFSTLESIRDRFKTLQSMKAEVTSIPGLDASKIESVNIWVEEQQSIIVRSNQLTKDDADAAVDIAAGLGEQFMLQRSSTELIILVLSYGSSILSVWLRKKQRISHDLVHQTFRPIMTSLAMDLQVSKPPERSAKRQKVAGFDWDGQPQGTHPEVRDDLVASEIALLLGNCVKRGTIDDGHRILEKIKSETQLLGTFSFKTFIIPFLRSTAERLAENGIQVTTSPYKGIYQRIVWFYVHRFLMPKPTKPKHWTMQTVRCDCFDCNILNQFLRDPRRSEESFPMAKFRRTHVAERLDRLHTRSVTHREIRFGSPYKLHVTKHHVEYTQERRRWETTKKNVEGTLNLLGSNLMQRMFNVTTASALLDLPEYIAAIRRDSRSPLAVVPQGSAMSQLSTSAAAVLPSNNKPSANPPSRQAEIVDLTGDGE